MGSEAIVYFTTLVVVVYFLRKITTISLSHQEPPALKPRVPLIGHIIGIMKHQSAYSSVLQYVPISIPPHCG